MSKLTHYKPFSAFSLFDNELNNFFNQLSNHRSDTKWIPAVDVIEADDHFELRAEIPGVSQEDVKIAIEDNVLTISGEKNVETKDEDYNCHRIERSSGKFERSFQLPKTVETDKTQADYKAGILTISLPKVEETKPKEIEIKVG
ncbi:TPA: Hsp20/alpha crystallin family protein [Candidatus Poribacteria bacterium]|jgi:HSP20 family protein|nr:Hsp20/alpha crystallin family protein [Candidatus Poribacteria bacterium]HIA64676.1 Hsp20/alpha crystallin family protein [Candidatus Poribacteria bacterium]HIB90793.1 Hsp20/alpha crystallin family protein [Candidatus Poribacteria bacterium]HIC02300.1 Hsp20/alpha crystallin family protein [Candidatus Poribacteria bacterium]HIN30107.1 Hsp20/alpha crystallin family protein [Candidatus Poribacteria bacterium]